MKLKILLSTVVITLSASGAWAAGAGTTGASFLKVGVGARPLAMGSAGSAVETDANAVNWNPGLLGNIKERSVTASYNMLFIDESQGFVGYAAPIEGGSAWGVGVNYLTVADIEKRLGDTDSPDSKFSNNNTAVSFSYARSEIRPGLSLGASFKYIQQKLDTHSDKAMAMDLGTAYKINSNWTAGFAVQNLGSKIGPDKLPLTFKGGAAVKLLDGKLLAAADLDWLANDERMYLDLGGEYALGKYVAFRAGYQVGRSQDKLGGLTGFAAGLGAKYEKYSFDYAYVPFGDLGNTHRMTVGYRF